MHKIVLGLLVTLFIPFTRTAAFAQPKEAAAAAAPAHPKMSPEGKKFLEGMLGNWTIKDGAFKMGDQTMKGKMTLKCEKAVNGWATLCKGKMDFGKAMQVDGLYTLAWDIGTGEGHMLEVEDSPTVHNHVGKWSDDKTISLVRTGKNMEGKDETDTVTFTWVSPKEVTFAATGKSGTTTNWTFNGTMKK